MQSHMVLKQAYPKGGKSRAPVWLLRSSLAGSGGKNVLEWESWPRSRLGMCGERRPRPAARAVCPNLKANFELTWPISFKQLLPS